MKPNAIDASALHLLHRAGQRAEEHFAAISGRYDLTPRQFAVLKAVADSPEPSQTTIVDKTGIDRSTLAEMIRRMVDKGLLSRRRDRRDARAYVIRLTAAGQAALDELAPVAHQADEALLSPLSERERKALLEALARILETER